MREMQLEDEEESKKQAERRDRQERWMCLMMCTQLDGEGWMCLTV